MTEYCIRCPANTRNQALIKYHAKVIKNTYIEYFGLNKLSTASTVWSLKNLFIVKMRDMKVKIVREVKTRVTGSTRVCYIKVGLTTRRFERQPR